MHLQHRRCCPPRKTQQQCSRQGGKAGIVFQLTRQPLFRCTFVSTQEGGESHEQMCDFGIMGMWYSRVPQTIMTCTPSLGGKICTSYCSFANRPTNLELGSRQRERRARVQIRARAKLCVVDSVQGESCDFEPRATGEKCNPSIPMCL